MINPDQTIFVAALVFLLTLLSLNYLLFKPLFRVLDERQARTAGLRSKAHQLHESYEASLEKYQASLKEERQRGYKVAEEARKEALEERARRLAEARQKADQAKAQTRKELEQEVESSKEFLKQEAGQLSRLITAQVLRRQA